MKTGGTAKNSDFETGYIPAVSLETSGGTLC